MSTSAELYMHTLPVSTMMNMTCPEDFQLTLNNQAALHNIQALQAGNFLLQRYLVFFFPLYSLNCDILKIIDINTGENVA